MQTYESDANIGNIKILAVDMDKTLLTDERVLPQGLDERLDKLAEAGIVFCPASGRPAPNSRSMFEDIKSRIAFLTPITARALSTAATISIRALSTWRCISRS